MEKLSQISSDVQVGTTAAYNFWKHVAQLLVEMGSIGTIKFEEERKSFPEEQLSDIKGRYFKLKFKNPNPIRNTGPLEYLTPIDETLLGQDGTDTDTFFIDDS